VLPLSTKTAIAKLATPAVRLVARYLPFTRRYLWNGVIGPYFAWRDYEFVARTQFGVLLKGTTSDVIQRYIYYFGAWDPNVEAFLRARLRPGDTFVDVGANIGYFTLLGAKLVGQQGRVVAIEASAGVMEQLTANILRNRQNDLVRCVRSAASDREGIVVLYAGQTGNIGSASIVRAEGKRTENVPSAPLEGLLLSSEIESVRVIKIDVEGAESLVFKGMQALLPRLRPDAEIVMEITPELSDTDGVVEVMARKGWNAYALKPQDSIENYFTPMKPSYAARIVDPITSRIDVVFSRVDTDRITYTS
jgi:FkbM family methyltransferase